MITPFKSRTVDNTLPVRVYRNLHAKTSASRWSILQAGKVVGHADKLLLRSVIFRVSEAGRQRVLRTGQKNVHAFVEGWIVGSKGAFGIDAQGPDLPAQIKYSPYEAPGFTTDVVTPPRLVNFARGVLFNIKVTGCYLTTEPI